MLCVMATLCTSHSFAQQLNTDDYKFFNHMSAGVSLGLDGIGIEIAAPLTYNFAVRTGYTFMPKFKYTDDLDLTNKDGSLSGAFLEEKVDLEGTLNKNDFKLLFDWYPFKNSSFHATAGFYVGSSTVVKIRNKKAFLKEGYWGNSGIEFGDPTLGPEYRYTMISDQEGNVRAEIKANSFKPYVGIGFGRAVPKKRVGVQFDCGVQFWGTPKVLTHMNYVDRNTGEVVTRYEKIKRNRILNEKKDYQDIKDGIGTIQKIGVYPVLTLRINGRIF